MTKPVCQAAIDLVKNAEGWSRALPDGGAAPYLCPAKIWTIGYGSTRDAAGRAVTSATSPVSKKEGEALLARDLAAAGASVDQLVTVPLNDHQRGALASWVYNLGAGKLKGSTLLRVLNGGDYASAAQEFGKWVYGGGRILPGLVTRRRAERALFES